MIVEATTPIRHIMWIGDYVLNMKNTFNIQVFSAEGISVLSLASMHFDYTFW